MILSLLVLTAFQTPSAPVPLAPPATTAPAAPTAPTAPTAPHADPTERSTTTPAPTASAAATSAPTVVTTPTSHRIFIVKPALSGMPPSIAATVTSTMAQAIAREGFNVVTADDVRTIIDQQADLGLLGGDADPLALSALANAVGADMLVAAVVSAVDGDTVVQVRLIDPQRSAVLARRELKASEQNNEVLPTIENAARLVLQPLLAEGRANLSLKASEEGANVVVDGDIVGVTPLTAPIGLSGGIHQIVVSKEGFVRSQETVRVKNGDTLTRDVRLRPSVEFLARYNADAGLYRTLAFVTTAGAVLSGVVVGVGGVGQVMATENSNAVSAAAQKEIDEKGLSDVDPRKQELDAQRTQAINDIYPWQGTWITGAVVFGATSLLAGYFWIFGNDPGRYDDLEAAVH